MGVGIRHTSASAEESCDHVAGKSLAGVIMKKASSMLSLAVIDGFCASVTLVVTKFSYIIYLLDVDPWMWLVLHAHANERTHLGSR